MQISTKFRRMLAVYQIFGGSGSTLDYSEEAALTQYRAETFGGVRVGLGKQSNGLYNGFAIGKHWMDVTVAMWKEDIHSGLLTKSELYRDPLFRDCHWWLDKVL